MATVQQLSGGTAQLPTGQQVSGGSINLIDEGDSPPTETNDLVESTLSGNVFSVGGTPAQNSPYMHLEVTASLTHIGRQLVARACAHTRSAKKIVQQVWLEGTGPRLQHFLAVLITTEVQLEILYVP